MPVKSWKLLEHPSFLGVSFLLSWIFLLFYSSIPGVDFSSPVEFMSRVYLSSTVVMSATVLIGAFALRGRRRLIHSRTSIVVASIVMAAGTVLSLYSSLSGSYALEFAGGILTGFSSGLVTLQWTGVYRPIGTLSAIMSIPLIILASVGVSRTVLYLPASAMYILICAMPLLSCACCLMAASETEGIDEGAGITDVSQARIYASFFAVVALYGFANGILDYTMGLYGYTAIFYLLVTVVTAIFVAYFIYKYARQQMFLYHVAPFLLLVMLLAPVMMLQRSSAGTELAAVGELVVEALIFTLAIAFANYYSVRSVATYALARVGLASGSALGWIAAGRLEMFTSGSLGSVIALMLAIAGVLAIAIWLLLVINNYTEATSEDADVDLTKEAVVASVRVSKSLDERCDELAEAHGISPRELDVMRLLARGYTSPKIQSELFIAPGTVNYHSRNIYAKLGVHSKQELISLVSSDGS